MTGSLGIKGLHATRMRPFIFSSSMPAYADMMSMQGLEGGKGGGGMSPQAIMLLSVLPSALHSRQATLLTTVAVMWTGRVSSIVHQSNGGKASPDGRLLA